MATAPSLLERIFEPVGEALTLEAANRIVGWHVDDETQCRIHELADKCNESKLADDEAAEYDRYLAALDIMAVLQSQARAVLEKSIDG